MPLSCPKCARLNPDDALYCHNDGLALRAYQAPVAANRLGRPFVFPTGRSCQTFDELVDGCLENWDDAKEFLKSGVLSSFLGGLGRVDLARTAQEAEKNPDCDRGLDALLGRLPAEKVIGPILHAGAEEIDLGDLKPGEDHDFEIRVKNQGRGLLHGSVSCQDSYWLAVGSGVGQKQKLFQTLNQEEIKLHIRGKVLRASNKPLEGHLAIQSSGGTATITIRACVPVKPFPDGCLGGALSPRQLAEKAKASAKEAIPYFESGTIGRWYEANGWTYPVQGPPANGLGAVQQFFEALGLTPPPKLDINLKALSFRGDAGEDLPQQAVQVTTSEKKPVFAHASSDRSWLKVQKTRPAGRAAEIPVSVHVPEESHTGENLQGTLTVTGNGNQKFLVTVSLAVTKGPAHGAGNGAAPVAKLQPAAVNAAAALAPTPFVPPLPPLPVAAVLAPAAVPLPGPAPLPVAGFWNAAPPAVVPLPAPPPLPVAGIRHAPAAVAAPGVIPITDALAGPPGEATAADRPASGANWLPWVPVGFLVVALAITTIRDLNTKKDKAVAVDPIDPFAGIRTEPPKQFVDLIFHDNIILVSLGKGGAKEDTSTETGRFLGEWDPSMRFGLVTTTEAPVPKKKLTFEKNGMTNNAVVRIDDGEWIYGEKPFRRKDNNQLVDNRPGRFAGQWRDGKHSEKLQGDRKGRRCVWEYSTQKVAVTQYVEIIVGQSGDHDTVLVQFEIKNEDSASHKVGLRFLLDTFIGNNDGVPFLIPGQSKLINTTYTTKRAADVPAFIQARERDEFDNPGTICQIGLKLPGLDAPDRVTLGAYPDIQHNQKDKRCLQEKTMWEVPLLNIQTLSDKPDSCVTMYWDPKPVAAGKSRLVGFTYGLGYLAVKGKDSQLALTAGGEFFPDGEVTVTAYVLNPKPGMDVALSLPKGWELARGEDAKKAVPPLPADASSKSSPVSWKVKAAGSKGAYTLEAETSTGLKESTKILIGNRPVFGN